MMGLADSGWNLCEVIGMWFYAVWLDQRSWSKISLTASIPYLHCHYGGPFTETVYRPAHGNGFTGSHLTLRLLYTFLTLPELQFNKNVVGFWFISCLFFYMWFTSNLVQWILYKICSMSVKTSRLKLVNNQSKMVMEKVR